MPHGGGLSPCTSSQASHIDAEAIIELKFKKPTVSKIIAESNHINRCGVMGCSFLWVLYFPAGCFLLIIKHSKNVEDTKEKMHA